MPEDASRDEKIRKYTGLRESSEAADSRIMAHYVSRAKELKKQYMTYGGPGKFQKIMHSFDTLVGHIKREPVLSDEAKHSLIHDKLPDMYVVILYWHRIKNMSETYARLRHMIGSAETFDDLKIPIELLQSRDDSSWVYNVQQEGESEEFEKTLRDLEERQRALVQESV